MDSASLYGTGLKKSAVIDIELLKSIPFVGWQTCKGNKEYISILDDNNVLYYRSGKRHGVPNYFDLIFEAKNPLKILRYETQSPSQSAFVCGIVPDRVSE